MRRTAGYIWKDYKTNTQIAKELKITPVLNKLLVYKKKWIQHVNRKPRIRLPRVLKHYSPTGKRNHGRPLKRILDTWDRNGTTSGPTPWQIDDDVMMMTFFICFIILLAITYHYLSTNQRFVGNLDICLAVHHGITFLLLPTWYTNFLFIYTNYIKLNSSAWFERNPLIIRRSTT